MTRVLWLSRHSPTSRQKKDLKEIFEEDIKIIQVPEKIEYPTDVLMKMEEHKADEVVAVLPIWMIGELLEWGVEPIKAEMERLWHKGKVDFRHKYFKRYKKVDIETKKLC